MKYEILRIFCFLSLNLNQPALNVKKEVLKSEFEQLHNRINFDCKEKNA